MFAQKHAENVKKSKFQGIISSSELLRTTNSQNLLGTSNTFYAHVFAHILEVNDNLRTRKNAMKEALIQTNHSLITHATTYQIALRNAIESKYLLILIANKKWNGI